MKTLQTFYIAIYTPMILWIRMNNFLDLFATYHNCHRLGPVLKWIMDILQFEFEIVPPTP